LKLEERNADYQTIANGLRGKTITSHKYDIFLRIRYLADSHNRHVVWVADTNYRIDLDNDVVRPLALVDEFTALYEADQVRFHHLLGHSLTYNDFGV
jgi:hypothetical protein